MQLIMVLHGKQKVNARQARENCSCQKNDLGRPFTSAVSQLECFAQWPFIGTSHFKASFFAALNLNWLQMETRDTIWEPSIRGLVWTYRSVANILGFTGRCASSFIALLLTFQKSQKGPAHRASLWLTSYQPIVDSQIIYCFNFFAQRV